MTREEYIKAILRAARLPRSVKRRLRADLLTDVNARLDSGETMEQVAAAMGKPAEVAAELSENYAPRPRTRGEKLLLAAIVLLAALLLGVLGWQLVYSTLLGDLLSLLAGSGAPVGGFGGAGVIGGADGPTAIYISAAPGLWALAAPLTLLVLLTVCAALYLRARKRP